MLGVTCNSLSGARSPYETVVATTESPREAMTKKDAKKMADRVPGNGHFDDGDGGHQCRWQQFMLMFWKL